MKKILTVMCIALMITGILVIAGCGDGDNGSDTSLDESVSVGIIGTFEGSGGEQIVFAKAGTFEGKIGGKKVQGTYKVIETADAKKVELAFEDGGEETWSIAISVGEVTAVIDTDGKQLNKE